MHKVVTMEKWPAQPGGDKIWPEILGLIFDEKTANANAQDFAERVRQTHVRWLNHARCAARRRFLDDRFDCRRHREIHHLHLALHFPIVFRNATFPLWREIEREPLAVTASPRM